jgi:hypothetical protein
MKSARRILCTVGLRLFFPLLGSLVPIFGFAQKGPDTLFSDKNLAGKVLRAGLESLTVSGDTIVNESAIDQSKPYEGRIIRNIRLRHVDFERSYYDTSKRVLKVVASVADALHGTTRPSVIRNHLLIRRGMKVNPYLIADNERFLREQDFILDSRIIVEPVEGQNDSVDVIVITRDVFSLGGDIGGSFPTATEVSIYDANFLGRGQRLEFISLVDRDRDPRFGYAFVYRKSSLFGSLTNAELAYSQLNTGPSNGDETEFSYYLRLTRPLVSPYRHFAGELEVSRNWSVNVYNKPDSLFLDYSYDIFDIWGGYNFSIKGDPSDRSRDFIALRYFHGAYSDRPSQEAYRVLSTYNNTSGVLAEYTFYKQNYYRTRYLFGFGRTEDVPYGTTASATVGYVREAGVERPYAALKWYRAVAYKKGNLHNWTAELGGFVAGGTLEDAVLNASTTYITRAVNVSRGTHLRALASIGYSAIFNERTSLPLEITEREIMGISADSLLGNRKAYFRVEATVYTPWNFLGFRLAPFAGANMAWLNCTVCEGHNLLVPGVSMGFRARNENLIFGTMEFRLSYISETRMTPDQFAFDFRQRLRADMLPGFVKRPDMVRY